MGSGDVINEEIKAAMRPKRAESEVGGQEELSEWQSWKQATMSTTCLKEGKSGKEIKDNADLHTSSVASLMI